MAPTIGKWTANADCRAQSCVFGSASRRLAGAPTQLGSAQLADSPASAASSVANASRLGELKRKYQQLISALHAAKTAIDAANQAKDVHDVTTSAIELNIHDVVTE